jgi:putative MATE family efflux protein
MVAVGMNFAFRGYFNGVNLSKIYLKTLVTMHICNVFLNWVLIFGHLGLPRLGVTGAGIGTALSTFLGTAIYCVLAFRQAVGGGFLSRLPDRRTMVSMLRLSVPAGVQRLFFAAGMTAFFWIVGRVGTAELAASNVLVHLLLVVILPGVGFGLGAASLVGQALGRRQLEDAKAWGWDVCRLSMIVVGSVSLCGLLMPRVLLSAFLHDPLTLELAVLPLRLVAATMILDTVGTVLLNALLGAGDSRRVMVISVSLQWMLFLPVAYLVGPVLGLGMNGVWVAQVAYRGIQALVFIWIWHRGRWAKVVV